MNNVVKRFIEKYIYLIDKNELECLLLRAHVELSHGDCNALVNILKRADISCESVIPIVIENIMSNLETLKLNNVQIGTVTNLISKFGLSKDDFRCVFSNALKKLYPNKYIHTDSRGKTYISTRG